MQVICVGPDHIRSIWPHVGRLVKRAIDRGYTDWGAVESNIFDGLWLLWIAWDGKEIKGAAVTGLVGDACEIIACAGDAMKTWVHLIADIEQYARNEGRKRMRIIGRRGWLRVLPEYKQTAVVLERAL